MSHAETITDFFYRAVAVRGNEPALGYIESGELHWLTWQQVHHEAQALAATLRVAGIEPGDRVAHVSENRYEWVITDLAVHLAGAVHVPIHVTLSGEQIAGQIADSGARLVIASSAELAAKFAKQLSKCVDIWLHNDKTTAAGQRPAGDAAKRQATDGPTGNASSAYDLATILYTSGTTGLSRGVMLSHSNLATNAAAAAEAFGANIEQTRLCLLPLSHIYARTCDLYTWVYHGSRLVLAENRDTLGRDFQLTCPTAFNGVPYLYQKIADKIRASNCSDQRAALQNYFGGRMEWLTCGGAALAPDVERWYADQGLPILCGYGLTESAPVISMSTPANHRMGSVGRVLADVDVRIAADGEILAHGPNVMLGYWHDEAATGDVLRDGWLHTGDLGELDADGFLFIRGRKKEIIVLSTGKNVSPTSVESRLTASPLIEQAAVFGDGQSALVALIVPAVGGVTRQECEREIARYLSGAAHEQQVRGFAILDRHFSIERGELTPKLSLCRTTIARNFAAELAAIGR